MTKSECKTIELPDGFNGSKMKFFADPIEVDGDLVKLQCAMPGKGHLIRWARKPEITIVGPGY